MAGVLRTGKQAQHLVTHGGQHQVVSGHMGPVVAVKAEDGWRRVNRNGSMTRKPEWTDEHALAHGDKRALEDFRKESKEQSVQAASGVFRDRRVVLPPNALRKF